MTKHDEVRDDRSDYERQQDHADAAARAESARVAQLGPGNDPASGEAPVEPHTEMFPHQPHGQAGQPQNRPAHEGHQGMTPIQPEDPTASPTEAVTHGEPNQIVDTEYTVQAGSAGASTQAGDDKKSDKRSR